LKTAQKWVDGKTAERPQYKKRGKGINDQFDKVSKIMQEKGGK